MHFLKKLDLEDEILCVCVCKFIPCLNIDLYSTK
jgi:hypothetical protein